MLHSANRLCNRKKVCEITPSLVLSITVERGRSDDVRFFVI